MWQVQEKEELLVGIWWGNLRERDHLENLGVDWRIILKLIFEKLDGVVDRISVAQNRGKWRAVVNMAMILQFP
jgi:hypothetical protein